MRPTEYCAQHRSIFSNILRFGLWFYLFPFTFCLTLTSVALAKDEQLTDEEVVVKTEGPHRLLLPKDWPIEQKDGRVGPVPVETYLSMKFGQVREAFDALDKRLAGLEQRLKTLEDDNKTLQRRMSVLEKRTADSEVLHGPTTQDP